MITRDQWNKLTPQQQWDHYCLLVSECGDSDEVEEGIANDPKYSTPHLSPSEIRQYYAGASKAIAESMSTRTGLPVDNFLPKVSTMEFNPVTGQITNKETHYLFSEHEEQSDGNQEN